VASDGTYTLYPWAKDAAGNVSAAFATPRTVVVDTTAPSVTSTVPANGATGVALNSTVTVNWNEPVDCATVTTTSVTVNPVVGWTKTSCSGGQAVFTPSGQTSITSYTITVGTGIRDANGNAMTANYSFSYITADVIAPSSTITAPANGAIVNSASANPYTISGAATDNVSVTGIEVSTNGGTTWVAATCTGCPGVNVTWSYSWTLPADGSYNIRSRAKDASNNTETPGPGNTVTVDRTAPSVSSTNPANGATGTALNSNVTIIWSENVNCSTVNITNITINAGGWTLSTCSNNQAIFTTSGQAGMTAYTVTVTTGVRDANGNPMAAINSFSYTTADVTPPASTITSPANGATINSASPNPYTISGSASDNVAVQGIEVSTNGGATWSPATCTGCPGVNVTWTYSWTLPADGSYNIRSRARDASNNTETPGAGSTVTIDRTAPSVNSTVPVNGALDVLINSNVTIAWSENVNCATVNTINITSTNPGWALLTCGANQAIFTASTQAYSTTYSVTVTTGVTDTAGNSITANYLFSYTTEAMPNNPPSNPTGLTQYKTDEVTTVGQGKWSNETTVIMKAAVSDPNGDTVQLQVEIQPNTSAFTGTPNCTSGPAIASGGTAKATCGGLINGSQYKWQARTIDAYGLTSGWAQFGTSDQDFGVDTVAPTYIWNTPAAGTYYKNGSPINVDVTVTEAGGSGILNGTDCTAAIDSAAASFTGIVIYSPSTGKCTGTLTLNNPSGLINGAHNLTVQVPDTAGNSVQSAARLINIDNTLPSSAVITPSNGTMINTGSPNPYTVSGTASDNAIVSSIEVSTNGGTTWVAAACTGCPGANVTWTYSWTLPADGSYNIKGRAKDSANNTETPGAGVTVTVDRTVPSVSTTSPSNGASGTALNGSVTIFWTENVNCTTVSASSITISSGGWMLSSCSGSQAVFTTSGQTNLTSYTVTVSTAVKDQAGNSMAANYVFSFTTAAMSLPTLTYPAAPYDNGVDPDTGDTRITFTFAIVYTDLENDAPAAGYPKIYIGDNDGYFSYAMIEENPADTNYTDGKIYSFTTGIGAAQDLRFYFKVQAATGDTTAVQLPSGVSAYNVGPAVYLLSGYNLAGAPKNIASGSWTYTSVLGDDSGYQLCYKWDSTGLDTVSGTQGSWINNTSGVVQTGASYYIWATDTLRRVDEPAGVANDPRAFIDITLDANGGWTAITNPYNAIIKLQDVKVVRGAMEYTYTQAVMNGWISNSIYEWEGDGPGWSFKAFNDNPAATLEPWMGYFIYVYDTTSTKLRIYAPAP
ncbi:MAG: Ig-like domain-containing protein, partial [Nitrospirae bacterium]|nr:Ig-like domain-containing protein [Nitrospirota bacterium]